MFDRLKFEIGLPWCSWQSVRGLLTQMDDGTVFPDRHQHHYPQTHSIDSHLLHLATISCKIRWARQRICLQRKKLNEWWLASLSDKRLPPFNLPPYRILAKAFSLASGARFCVPGNVPFLSIVIAFLRAISNNRFLSIRSSELRKRSCDRDRLKWTTKKKTIRASIWWV